MYYIWAVPATIIFYSIYAYLCKQNNTGNTKDLIIVWLYGCIFTQPLWALLSRVSKRLTFDGLLFDSLIAISYSITMILLTKVQFNALNYTGIFLIFIGLILTKVQL